MSTKRVMPKPIRFQYDGRYFRLDLRSSFKRDFGLRFSHSNDFDDNISTYVVINGPIFDTCKLYLSNQEQYAGMSLEEFINKVRP